MSITSCLSRITKLNEDLTNINSLQRLKNMSGKSVKRCKCNHHVYISTICGTEKPSPPDRDTNVRRPCRPCPQLCLCNPSDGQSIVGKSAANEDLKSRSENSIHPGEQLSEVVEENEAKGLEYPVACNRSITKNSVHFETGNVTEKLDKVREPQLATVETETINRGTKSEATDSDNLEGDRKDIEQMYKDLAEERKRNRELEEQLKKMRCSMQCLKDKDDEQTNSLKDSLEKAKNQAKLAARSRNLAMDLAKQSRDQTDLVKASRGEILKQISTVKDDYSKLQCECESLRSQLHKISENEAKKCAEVDDKVSRMKCAVKQKEMALASEKSELEETVAELTNLVKIQKKRICDLTAICTKQRSTLQNNENCMSAKIAQLSEAENNVQSMNSRCKKMQEDIDCLKCCLKKETEARNNLQAEFDERRDNCNCEMQIKDKIIADQVETIKKLKKLLQDSEKMAQQAAREFESLRDELRCLKQSNESLRAALQDTEAQLISDESELEYCERCHVLESQINNLAEQKHKALTAAKFAAEKLGRTTAEYNREHRYLTDLVHRKDAEIELLKKEILHNNKVRYRRSNDFVDQ